MTVDRAAPVNAAADSAGPVSRLHKTMHEDDVTRMALGRDTPYAWSRLICGVLIAMVGNVSLWCYVVALPAVEQDFGLTRSQASIPYTVTLLGFGFGGVLIGWLTDRIGIVLPLVGSSVALLSGFAICALAPNFYVFLVGQAVLGLFGASPLFAALMADTSHWFNRQRGVAVAIAASGNYLSGTIWPPILQHFIETQGWRHTYLTVALVCVITMLPLTLRFKRPAPVHAKSANDCIKQRKPIRLPPALMQVLLTIAGFSCCVAMSMPQVHIVAYSKFLGHGAGVGSQLLSVMLFFGIFSRIASGVIADRIGGFRTVLIGSLAQCVALVLFSQFNSVTALYLIAVFYGLGQGGIVPGFAIIVRMVFPAEEAGWRISVAVLSTVIGMAFGGWLSGAIFDRTGAYQLAFAACIAFSMLNAAILILFLTKEAPTATPSRLQTDGARR